MKLTAVLKAGSVGAASSQAQHLWRNASGEGKRTWRRCRTYGNRKQKKLRAIRGHPTSPPRSVSASSSTPPQPVDHPLQRSEYSDKGMFTYLQRRCTSKTPPASSRTAQKKFQNLRDTPSRYSSHTSKTFTAGSEPVQQVNEKKDRRDSCDPVPLNFPLLKGVSDPGERPHQHEHNTQTNMNRSSIVTSRRARLEHAGREQRHSRPLTTNGPASSPPTATTAFRPW